MRIINGEFQGRTFTFPSIKTTRPTSSFAKTALFNILANKISFDDIVALDLFAGIGSIGFEFASMNVKKITMVEKNFHAFSVLQKIEKQLETKNTHIIKADVLQILHHLSCSYDIIFADPPYDWENPVGSLLHPIFEKNLLHQNGIFILEHYKKNSFHSEPTFLESRIYGDSAFSFFSRKD